MYWTVQGNKGGASYMQYPKLIVKFMCTKVGGISNCLYQIAYSSYLKVKAILGTSTHTKDHGGWMAITLQWARFH